MKLCDLSVLLSKVLLNGIACVEQSEVTFEKVNGIRDLLRIKLLFYLCLNRINNPMLDLGLLLIQNLPIFVSKTRQRQNLVAELVELGELLWLEMIRRVALHYLASLTEDFVDSLELLQRERFQLDLEVLL